MPGSLGEGQYTQDPGLLAVLNLLKYDGVSPTKDYLYCFVILINSFSDWLNYLGHFNQITAAVYFTKQLGSSSKPVGF